MGGEAAAIAIRAATSADVPEIEGLVDRSVRGLHVEKYSPEQIERSLASVFGVDTQLVEDGTFFVAEAGRAIVGCGGWSARTTLYGGDRLKAGVEDARLDPERDAARIRAFFVDPAWARRGIGSRLLTHCEAEARAAGFRRAELVATLPGVPLYEAFGYAAVEGLETDLRDGIVLPCVRMTKAFA